MDIAAIGLFTDKLAEWSSMGVVGRAFEQQKIRLHGFDLRQFCSDACRVDDKPYGGGAGMVLRYEPVAAAIDAAKSLLGLSTPVWLMSPSGQPLQQHWLEQQVHLDQVIMLAGRYEGIDERVGHLIDKELSIGDYVLSGGELPMMVVIDALIRLKPGVLGDTASLCDESFAGHGLDWPSYTRPAEIGKHFIPSVLLSGNHADIAAWRAEEQRGRTWSRRADLLSGLDWGSKERQQLARWLARQPAC